MRNYLLDAGFQLKYAGYLVAIAALLSLVLGWRLWATSQALVGQSKEAVAQGLLAVSLGQKVAEESKKVSSVVEMNLVEDPFYADQPELLEAFKADRAKQSGALSEQQKELEGQAQTLADQAGAIARQQRAMLTALFSLLALLVIGVGLAGIVITHRIAGPIFKMTRQIRQIGEGHWRIPDPLRKGDELAHFFGAFEAMVRSMRDQRQRELDLLDELGEAVGGEDGDDRRARVDALRAEMNKALEG
jgi:methyl-accepting chemotaxis protein